MAAAVASRYARALADLAFDPRKGLDPQAVLAGLARFDAALSESAELRGALLTPAVPAARKRAVVERLAVRLDIAPLVRNFLYVVISHRRTAMFGEIREAYQAQLDERLGLVEAGVTTARELKPEVRGRVEQGLERLTGKRVRARFGVDEGLIGGIVVRIGSTIYDGSVRGQLEALRRKLMD